MDRKFNDITTIRNTDTVPYLSFKPLEKFDWLVQGFSTRLGGVSTGPLSSLNLGFERMDEPENVRENIRRLACSAGFDFECICLPNQWHTNNIRICSEKDYWRGIAPTKTDLAIDAQLTNQSKVVLFTYGADCTPIYLVDEVNHAIGLCHSGWKGTLNSISADAISLMSSSFGTKPENITAVIGPSISMDAYEVGHDVADLFVEKYKVKVSRDSKLVKLGVREGKYQLDLWEANYRNLLTCGLIPENIFISGVCSYTEKELLYSHRRDGNARGVMAAFLSIR